jgi:hypothetical protein
MLFLSIPRRQVIVPLDTRYTFTTGVHGDERGTVTVSRNHTLHLRGTDVGDRVVVIDRAGVQVWTGFIAGVTSEADGARTYDLIGLWQAVANIPITFKSSATFSDFRNVERGEYNFGAINVRPERYEITKNGFTLRKNETYDNDNAIAFWFDFPDKYLKITNYEINVFFNPTGLCTGWNKRISRITNGVETVLYSGTSNNFLTISTPFDALYLLLWPPAAVNETVTGASTMEIGCSIFCPTIAAYISSAFLTPYAPFLRLPPGFFTSINIFQSLDDALFGEHVATYEKRFNRRVHIQRQTVTLLDSALPLVYRSQWRTDRAAIARNWGSVPTYVYSRWTDETNRVRRTPDATVSTMLTNREYVVRSVAPDGRDEAKAVANRDAVVSASLTPPPVVTVTLPLRGRGLASGAGAQVPAYLAEPGDELLISEAYAKGEIVAREISNSGVRYDVSIKQASALDVFAR